MGCVLHHAARAVTWFPAQCYRELRCTSWLFRALHLAIHLESPFDGLIVPEGFSADEAVISVSITHAANASCSTACASPQDPWCSRTPLNSLQLGAELLQACSKAMYNLQF